MTPSYIFQPLAVAVGYGAARRGIGVDHRRVLGIDLALDGDFRAAGRFDGDLFPTVAGAFC